MTLKLSFHVPMAATWADRRACGQMRASHVGPTCFSGLSFQLPPLSPPIFCDSEEVGGRVLAESKISYLCLTLLFPGGTETEGS